ncbi:hypothetical protein C8J57DRAFT_1499725 [Mycena rebaudengoi]|nr:hypothetical protein C8J57DRAFT_1499725 [Mycena rebaudengoi]
MAIASYRLNATSDASATESSFSATEMQQPSRNYSYPPSSAYSGNNSPPATTNNGYTVPSPSYEQPPNGRPYYPPTSNVRMSPTQSNQYYTPIAPAPPSDRYPSSSYRSSGLVAPQGYPSSNSPPYSSQYNTASDNRGYPSSSTYSYDPNAPRSGGSSRSPSSQYPSSAQSARQFIPTPSETYASRPPRPSSDMHHSSRPAGPYSTVPHPIPTPSSSSRPPHNPRSRNSLSTSPTLNLPPGERYVCDICHKDFSRAHDRKRHFETQHAPKPVTHKCIHCDKDFSRADSLKRHIQNGCDEAPQ